MTTGAGRTGVVLAALAAAVLGCETKDGGSGVRPVDSFGVADADVVIKAAPARIVGSKFYAELSKKIEKLPSFGAEKPESLDAAVKETVGLDLSQLESVVMSTKADGTRHVFAVASKSAIDRDAVIETVSKEGLKPEKRDTHAGVDLYSVADDDDRFMDRVIAFPTRELLVLGTKEDVKRGIDLMKAGTALQFSGKMTSLLAAAPKGAGLFLAAIPPPGLAEAAGPAAGMVEASAKAEAVTLAASAGDALDVRVLAEFETDKDAEDARAEVKQGLAGMKQNLGPMLEMAGPLKDLFDGIKVGGAGKTADVRVTVRASIVEAIPQIMGMFMMGAMGGGAAGMPEMPESGLDDLDFQ